MATHRSAVPPEKAWKLGRASTIPVTALWAGAAGALINTTTGGTGTTGTLVLGGITIATTAVTALGAHSKGLNEKARGIKPMNKIQAAYLTACTCAAGSWITWVAATTPFAAIQAGTFVAGGLAAWLLYPWYRHSRREAIAYEHATDHPAATERPLTDWEAICEEAGLKGMTEHADRIETPGGYVVRFKLPRNGRVTFTAFQATLPKLSVIAGHDLNLRSGALRAEPGANDAEVLLHVVERDVLAELIPLPDDMRLIDSNEPFDIGLFEDATPMLWDFLRHGMVVGVTDSGKSNTLNVIIKKGAQMVDTLLWVIDPKGGRMARPWIQALLDGKAQRPILDWVATNGGPTTMGRELPGGVFKLNKSPDEYHYILDTAIDEMDRRANLNLGGEKVRTSPDLPRIVIIIDEAADVLGDSQLLDKCKLLVRKGRSEGIIILIAGQRGTASMLGDGDFRSQILNAIGLGVRSQTDANMIFPDDPQVSKQLTKLTHQGTMLVKRGAKGRAIPGKGYRIEADETSNEIYPLSIALSGRRPGLPADAVAHHGSVYADRWSHPRIQHMLTSTPTADLAKTDTLPAAPAGPARPQPGPGAAPGTASTNRAVLDAFAARGRARNNQNPDDIEVSAEGEQIAADFQNFLADLSASDKPQTDPTRPAAAAPATARTGDPDAGIDPRRALIRQLVRDTGPAGIENADIHQALTTRFGAEGWDRTVVTTWITQDCQAGLMHRPARGRVAPGPRPSDEQAGA